MATRTISNAGGGWSSTSAWVEGIVPTAADDVVATATSGNLSLNTSGYCRSIDLTDYVGRLDATSGYYLTIGTSTVPDSNVALKFGSGMTYTYRYYSQIRFFSTYTGGSVQIIDFGGKSCGYVYIKAVSSTNYQFAASCTMDATGTFRLDIGTIDFNGYSHTFGIMLIGGTSTRSLNFGSSDITVSGSNGTVFNASLTTGMTVAANSGTITFTGANITILSNAKDWNGLSWIFNGSGYVACNTTGTVTVSNLTRTGTVTSTDSFVLGGDITATAAFTANGNSATNRILVSSDTPGHARSITAGSVVVTNADFQDITGAGAANWNLSSITGNSGDCGGNSGITFTTAINPVYFYASSTGSKQWSGSYWWTGSGGTGSSTRVPLPQDNVRFDSNSFGSAGISVNINMPRIGTVIDFTNTSNNPTVSASVDTTIYGSLTLVSGMTFSSTYQLTFAPRTSHTVTTAGQTMPNTVLWGNGGTITQQDAFTSGKPILFRNSNWSSNDYALTVSSITDNFNNNTDDVAKTVTLGTSVLTTQSGSLTHNTTLNSSNANLVLVDSGTSAKLFYIFSSTWATITCSGNNTNLSGTYTIGTLHVNTAGYATGLILDDAKTYTITGTITTNGSSGNLAKLVSATSGNYAEIVKTTAGNIVLDYMSIKDIYVSGTGDGSGVIWYAGRHSIDVSGNSGWTWASYYSKFLDAVTTGNSAVVAKQIPHTIVAATVSNSALIKKQDNKPLIATTETNSVTMGKQIEKRLSAATSSMSAIIVRGIKKILFAVTNVVSAILDAGKTAQQFIQDLTAAMNTYAAGITKTTEKFLTSATTTISATITKQGNKVFNFATLSNIGSILRKTNKDLFGVMPSMLSSTTRSTNKVLTAVASSYSGTLGEIKAFNMYLTAAMSSMTSVIRKAVSHKITAATSTNTAEITKGTLKEISGSMATMSGLVIKLSVRIMAAVTSAYSAVVVEVKSVGMFFAATMSTMSAMVVKSIEHKMTGFMSIFSPLFSRATQKLLNIASFSFVNSTMSKCTTKTLSAITAGNLSILNKNIQKTLSSVTNVCVAVISKLIDKVTNATTNSMVGTITKRSTRIITAILSSLSSTITTVKGAGTYFFIAFTATISFTGNIKKSIATFFIETFGNWISSLYLVVISVTKRKVVHSHIAPKSKRQIQGKCSIYNPFKYIYGCSRISSSLQSHQKIVVGLSHIRNPLTYLPGFMIEPLPESPTLLARITLQQSQWGTVRIIS